MKVPTLEDDVAFREYFMPQNNAWEAVTWVTMRFLPEDIYTKAQLRECFKRLQQEEKKKKEEVKK